MNAAEKTMYRCMQRGLAFKTIQGSVITLRPALVIKREEMDKAADILDVSIAEVQSA